MRRVATVGEWNKGVADLKPEELLNRDGLARERTVTPSVRWLCNPWYLTCEGDLVVVDGWRKRLTLNPIRIITETALRVCGKLKSTAPKA